MRKALTLLIGLATILAFTMWADCSSEQSNKEKLPATVFTELPNGYGEVILVDKETGVQYICINGHSRLALSVRLDADGKPMVDRGVKK